MKDFLKTITGVAAYQRYQQSKKTAELTAVEQARLAARSPKEVATDAKEPWVSVLDTHVDKNNIRNGFFELDWNEYFILQLTNEGYTGDSDEAIIGQWFTELCRTIGTEAEIPDMERRGSGYVNVNNIVNSNKSEVY